MISVVSTKKTRERIYYFSAEIHKHMKLYVMKHRKNIKERCFSLFVNLENNLLIPFSRWIAKMESVL